MTVKFNYIGELDFTKRLETNHLPILGLTELEQRHKLLNINRWRGWKRLSLADHKLCNLHDYMPDGPLD